MISCRSLDVKILFIQKDVFIKPAIMLLSAIMKKHGHSCDIFIQDLEKKIEEKIISAGADLVAFSISTGEYPWMRILSSKLRPYFKGSIICGGPHPTFFPEMINDEQIDAICMGEGDEAFPEFVKALETGSDVTAIPNFVVRQNGKIYRNRLRPLIENLDILPFFDRTLYHKYPLYRDRLRHMVFHDVVITERGCPFGCSFCFNKIYNQMYRGMGKIFRRRSVSNVINELKAMKVSDKSPCMITFEDDVFTQPPREWLSDFLGQYRDLIGIPFKINTRASLIDDDIAKRLKEAGCHAIKIGVESGNEYIRNTVFNKGISDNDIKNAAFVSKRYGLKLQTFNIFGAPGETVEMALETFDLNRIIRPDFTWCSLLNPYPGTEIFNYCAEHGFLDKDFTFMDIGYSYFYDFPLKLANKREITNLQRLTNTGIILHVSKGVMKALIKLPLSGLYKLLYQIGFAISLKKINNISLFDLIKLILSQLFRYRL
jgi:anaerobic magnesium-protoporphyrin IX monomethyl ester cyclase